MLMSSVVCLHLQSVCVCVCNERDILLETPVWQEPETDHHLVDLIPTERESASEGESDRNKIREGGFDQKQQLYG